MKKDTENVVYIRSPTVAHLQEKSSRLVLDNSTDPHRDRRLIVQD
jgi:hypothetical protein